MIALASVCLRILINGDASRDAKHSGEVRDIDASHHLQRVNVGREHRTAGQGAK